MVVGGVKKLYLLTGANGHLGHTIRNYLSGDVRDVALAVLQAEKKGRDHAFYIVNGHEVSMADLTRFITHKEPKVISAKWLERIAPMIEHLYPNMSPYALYTLQSPSQFSHQKATVDLGYQPRPWQETIQDMEMIKDEFDW